MNLLNKIQEAIYTLEVNNVDRENIKITTSFITKRLLEEIISEESMYNVTNLDSKANKIFGIKISFNHFSNDIVIYDVTRACIDDKFKITLTTIGELKMLKIQC